MTGPISPDFDAFIRSPEFPCVGAKSTLALRLLEVFEADDILSASSDHALHEALLAFGRLPPRGAGVRSFACLFSSGGTQSEEAFEQALWARLQALHDLDARGGCSWADAISPDPNSAQFAMSVGGVAYFVVGLHPGASRAARRFGRPAMVFNPHAQFERLRADGRYGAIQSIVRDRELALSGGTNPMLADFGEGGEARQYSGRRVGADWSCPLKVRG